MSGMEPSVETDSLLRMDLEPSPPPQETILTNNNHTTNTLEPAGNETTTTGQEQQEQQEPLPSNDEPHQTNSIHPNVNDRNLQAPNTVTTTTATARTDSQEQQEQQQQEPPQQEQDHNKQDSLKPMPQQDLSRDDLLQIADYLNTFQGFYLKQEGASLGTITLDDLQTIHETRLASLAQHHERENNNDQQVPAPVDPSVQEQKDTRNEPPHNNPDDTTPSINTNSDTALPSASLVPTTLGVRLQCIDRLWARVTLWNTKALAQQYLVPVHPTKTRSATTATATHPSTSHANHHHQNKRPSKRRHSEERDSSLGDLQEQAQPSQDNEAVHSEDDTDDEQDHEDHDEDEDDDSDFGGTHRRRRRKRKRPSFKKQHQVVVEPERPLLFSPWIHLPLSSYLYELGPPVTLVPKSTKTKQQPQGPGHPRAPFAQIFGQLYHHGTDNTTANAASVSNDNSGNQTNNEQAPPRGDTENHGPNATDQPTNKDQDQTSHGSEDNDDNDDDDSEIPLGLSLPPDSYTWPVFASIIHVLVQVPPSLLPQVHTSSFLGSQAHTRPNKHSNSSNKSWKPLPKFLSSPLRKFSIPDLVALFLRSLRNLPAKRHLIQLFEYRPLPSSGTATTTTAHHEYEYQARFRGNHKWLYSRSITSSSGLMTLQRWAISNQVLVTAPLVYQFLHTRYGPPGHKVPLPPPEYHWTKTDRKTPKQKNKNNTNQITYRNESDPSESDQDDEEEMTDWIRTSLIKSVQRAILRSWARRCERFLQPIFYSSMEQVLTAHRVHWFPLSSSSSAESNEAKSEEKNNKALWSETAVETILANVKTLVRTTGRSLSQVDRLIQLGHYKTTGSLDNALQQIMNAYIQAILQTNHGERPDFVQAMVVDFHEYLLQPLQWFDELTEQGGGILAAAEKFLAQDPEWHGNEDPHRMTMMMMMSHKDSVEPTRQEWVRRVLDSIPPPWMTQCQKCQRSFATPNTRTSAKQPMEIYKCASSQGWFHSICSKKPSPGKGNDEEGSQGSESGPPLTHRTKRLIESFSPLEDMFTVRIPSSGTIQDRSGQSIVIPNYADPSMADNLEFTELQITVRRTVCQGTDGKAILQAFGMNLCHVSLCQETMESLLEGKFRVWDMTGFPGGRIPFSISGSAKKNLTDGLMVHHIKPDCAASNGGIQNNDIITAVEVVRFLQPEGEDVKHSLNPPQQQYVLFVLLCSWLARADRLPFGVCFLSSMFCSPCI